MKYQSSSTHCSKGVSKVRIFKLKKVIRQGQCHRVKIVGTYRNVLSQGILMWKTCIKVIALMVSKGITKVKVFNKEVKLQGQWSKCWCRRFMAEILPILRKTLSNQSIKMLVPTVMSCHKKYSCEISKHSLSKIISKVKVSDRITEWQTFDLGVIKMNLTPCFDTVDWLFCILRRFSNILII